MGYCQVLTIVSVYTMAAKSLPKISRIADNFIVPDTTFLARAIVSMVYTRYLVHEDSMPIISQANHEAAPLSGVESPKLPVVHATLESAKYNTTIERAILAKSFFMTLSPFVLKVFFAGLVKTRM